MKSLRSVPLLPVVLGLAVMLFLGILAYVWAESEKAGPVLLDERGRQRQTQYRQ